MIELRFLALDLSLQATGVSWTHNHHGEPKVGCRTVHTARTRHGSTDIDHQRLHTILTDVAAAALAKPHLVVVEWLPQFDGHGDVTLRLAELHGVVKHWLYSRKPRIPYLDVRPPDLKIWATGNGNATKTAVREAVTATYGGLCHVGDDNQADALALLSMACQAYGRPLARVTAQKQTRALAGIRWPDLATETGPVVPVTGGPR
ncbi:hypothetical protein O7626_00320 [Micromonospora sp. WMMD1102]|uniref:hypothetical protein n=1 Tax=Micromonospora sp. WMMD1102 TaxID=3016105 RepID=UPI00241571E0|nr:hypothetical protein [Micromonospora sp. WMMD1102]MDG4784390.1 hypothetical protein [Micromonospora sp. WMMD1102]